MTKGWSIQLHHDSVVALAETRPELKPVPSYATLRRFISANGLAKRQRVTARRTDGTEPAEALIYDSKEFLYRLVKRLTAPSQVGASKVRLWE